MTEDARDLDRADRGHGADRDVPTPQFGKDRTRIPATKQTKVTTGLYFVDQMRTEGDASQAGTLVRRERMQC